MKSRSWIVTVLILGVLALPWTGCRQSIDKTSSVADTLLVTVLRLGGDVSFRRGATGAWQKLTTNLTLHAGDRLKAGRGAWAILRLPGGGVAQISGHSEMAVEEILPAATNKAGVAGTTLRLLKGIGLFRATNRSLRVKTPNAVTGVIGTVFGLEYVESDPKENGQARTRLVVKESKVWIAGSPDEALKGTTAPPAGEKVGKVMEGHGCCVIGTSAPLPPRPVNVVVPAIEDRLTAELCAFENHCLRLIDGKHVDGVTEKTLEGKLKLEGK